MKPLLIANFPNVVGGGELALEELAAGLLKRGHRPLIAVPGPGTLGRNFDRVLIPTSLPAAALAIRGLARECDLIHATGARGMAAASLAQTDKPLIWHVRVAASDKLDPVLSRLADLIIANSRATAARFVGLENVCVVYNGVRPPQTPKHPFSLTPGMRSIAVVARMTPEKGHIDLVPAARAIAAKCVDVEWVFVGDQETPEGKTLAGELALCGARFRFAGSVLGMANHLSEFPLVVIPSRIEGFGRVAAEALRAGTPVVARKVGGLIEVLEGVTDPWLPDNPEDWADKILATLAAPPDSRERLKELGARFSIHTHVELIIREYEQLLKKYQ